MCLLGLVQASVPEMNQHTMTVRAELRDQLANRGFQGGAGGRLELGKQTLSTGGKCTHWI